MKETKPDHIVFFDGVCSLCNGYVRFLMKRDPDGQFRVAPLDGDTADDLLPDALKKETTDTIIYRQQANGSTRYYTRSTAVIEILSRLEPPWTWLRWIRIVPRFIRDAVYDFVASVRYDWFGKYDACPAPEPEWKDRFLN